MRASSLTALGGLLLLLGGGRPLAAQRTAALDVGASVVRFLDDSTTIAGPSVGWRSTLDRRRLFGQLTLGGVGTVGAASGSASLAGGARMPVSARWLLEGAGELFGVAGTSVHSAVAATATARGIRLFGDGGAWARASTAVSRREAGVLPASAMEAGAWWDLPRWHLSAALLDQRAKAQLFTGPLRTYLIGTLPVHYQEAAFAARVEGDATSLELSAGVRRDPDAATVYQPTLSLTAAYWPAESHALTVSLSRTPPDWVRGADAAQWVALGVRFYEPRPATRRAARIRPVIVVSAEGEQRTVRVRAPSARTVELMADFTDWTPVSLSADGDDFERTMPLSAGSHRILVRVDGGAWRPAANTPAVADDLGGRVGLLVVP